MATHAAVFAVLLLALLAVATWVRREVYVNYVDLASADVMGSVLQPLAGQIMLSGVEEGKRCYVKGVLMPPQYKEATQSVKDINPGKTSCVVDVEKLGAVSACSMKKSSTMYDPYATDQVSYVTTAAGDTETGELKCSVVFNPFARVDHLLNYAVANDLDKQKELLEEANRVLVALATLLAITLKTLKQLYDKVVKAAAEERAKLMNEIAVLTAQLNNQKAVIASLTSSRNDLLSQLATANATNASNSSTIASHVSDLGTAKAALEQANSTQFTTDSSFRPDKQMLRSRMGSQSVCVGMAGGSTGTTQASSINCDGSAQHQRMTLDSSSRLQMYHSGRCLEVYGGSTNENAQVAQVPCSSSDYQRWDMDTSGRLHPRHNPSSCMDLMHTEPGAGVVTRKCGTAPTQRFTVSGDPYMPPAQPPSVAYYYTFSNNAYVVSAHPAYTNISPLGGAQWIWNSPNAGLTNVSPGDVRFQLEISMGSDMEAYLDFAVDNSITYVVLNSSAYLNAPGGYGSFDRVYTFPRPGSSDQTLKLKRGTNLLELTARNLGPTHSPAALAFCVRQVGNPGNVVARSSGSCRTG